MNPKPAPRRHWLWLVAAAVLLQLAAFLAYRAVSDGRAPRLEIESPGGEVREALGPGRPRLLHFWATWCAPCRDELPALLRAARRFEPTIEVLLVTVDGDWAPVRAFFPQGPPAGVYRADARDANIALGIAALPDTRVLDASGRTVLKLDGAQDWARPAVEARVRAALGGGSP